MRSLSLRDARKLIKFAVRELAHRAGLEFARMGEIAVCGALWGKEAQWGVEEKVNLSAIVDFFLWVQRFWGSPETRPLAYQMVSECVSMYMNLVSEFKLAGTDTTFRAYTTQAANEAMQAALKECLRQLDQRNGADVIDGG
jgi:hypothetical protein